MKFISLSTQYIRPKLDSYPSKKSCFSKCERVSTCPETTYCKRWLPEMKTKTSATQHPDTTLSLIWWAMSKELSMPSSSVASSSSVSFRCRRMYLGCLIGRIMSRRGEGSLSACLPAYYIFLPFFAEFAQNFVKKCKIFWKYTEFR